MQRKSKMFLSGAIALVCAAFLITPALSSAQTRAPGTSAFDHAPPVQWLNNVQPTSYWGLRGLTQLQSAEPLGAGRLNMAFSYSYFSQDQEIYQPFSGNLPEKGASVQTGRLSLAWGLNESVDIFAMLPYYIIGDAYTDTTGKKETASGFGHRITTGVQFAAPIPPEIPLRLSFTGFLSYGFGTDGSTGSSTNNELFVLGSDDRQYGFFDKDSVFTAFHPVSYAGYDYWDGRRDGRMEVVFKPSLALVTGNMRRGAKFMANMGFGKTLLTAEDWIFMPGVGIQIDPSEFMTLGVEANMRTKLSSIQTHDPFWITPSLSFRSPYFSEGLFGMSWIIGADFNMSGEKTTTKYFTGEGDWISEPTPADPDAGRWRSEEIKSKPLEGWRLYTDVVFAFDLFASRRAEMERQARMAAAEKERLRREAAMSSAQRDSIARQARADSLRLAEEMAMRARADSLRAQFVADSMAAAMGDFAARARADSLAQAMAAAEREAQLLAEREAQRIADSIAAAEREAALRGTMEEIEARRIADSIEAARRLAEERAKRSAAEQMMLNTGMLHLEAIEFMTGRAEIARNSLPYLRTIAQMLVKYPRLRIEIGGHTDNTGSHATNMRLSQQRAEAVLLFLVQTEPALAQMLTAKGYGPDNPVASNATPAGREQNRRVELKVLNPEVLQEYNP